LGGPRHKAQKKRQVNSPKQCYPHFHMTATEYAIYDVCRALSGKHDGILFFSGPRLAKRFRSMSKNTPYTALKSLLDMKWFEPQGEPGSRKDESTGKHLATRYKVLTHEEWAAKHPNCCPNVSGGWQELLSKLEGTDIAPSKFQGTVRPKMRERSVPISGNRPSQSEGTNLYKQPIERTHTSTDTLLHPSQFEGMATVPPSLDGANQASASRLKGEPFPEIGTEESRILTGRGLIESGGQWFTEMGTKVSPNALAILLSQGVAA
jgi:hypothetical protein